MTKYQDIQQDYCYGPDMPYYHIVMSHCSILSLPDWMKNPEFGSVTSLTTCLSLSYRPWDSVTHFHFENKWMNKCMNMVLNMGSDFSVAFLITCNYTIFQKQLILIFVQCTYTVMAAELIQILNFVCSILLYSRILYQCTTPMHWDRAEWQSFQFLTALFVSSLNTIILTVILISTRVAYLVRMPYYTVCFIRKKKSVQQICLRNLQTFFDKKFSFTGKNLFLKTGIVHNVLQKTQTRYTLAWAPLRLKCSWDLVCFKSYIDIHKKQRSVMFFSKCGGLLRLNTIRTVPDSA